MSNYRQIEIANQELQTLVSQILGTLTINVHSGGWPESLRPFLIVWAERAEKIRARAKGEQAPPKEVCR